MPGLLIEEITKIKSIYSEIMKTIMNMKKMLVSLSRDYRGLRLGKFFFILDELLEIEKEINQEKKESNQSGGFL